MSEKETKVWGIPFQKGESGNPNGRPKSLNLTTLLKAELEKMNEEEDGKTNAEVLMARVMKDAMKGDYKHRELAMKYIDGLPTQQIDHTNAGMPFVMPSEIMSKHDIDANTEASSEGEDSI